MGASSCAHKSTQSERFQEGQQAVVWTKPPEWRVHRLNLEQHSALYPTILRSFKLETMPKVSQAFGLKSQQPELDFVDVELNEDTRLFVDPLGLSQRVDRWSRDAHASLVTFFQTIIDHIRANRADRAQELLANLNEPNETRLGFSQGRPQGAGIGGMQADQIYARLAASTAVRTGFINSIEDCELMIEGVSHDKISDLTTNVIRKNLVDYTNAQCNLHDIPVQQAAIPPMFDPARMIWFNDYVQLPLYRGAPILFVPKAIVRWRPVFDSKAYYNDFVVNFLRQEELRAHSRLVRALKNGKLVVYKKDVKAEHPFAKEFLFEFSRQHPDVLRDFRASMERLERADRASDLDDPQVDAAVAQALTAVLPAIQTGRDAAGQYHAFMVGALEFLLYPHLGFPQKEREINEGRKRIDIVMENCARSGPFYDLPNVRQLPCPYILIECKNYSTDIANPELDQLAGRMGVNRGMFGLMCCRHFEDRATFIARCRDSFAALRQLIVPFDDATILETLEFVKRGERNRVTARLRELIAEVWV